MIVYGDPQATLTIQRLRERLRGHLDALQAPPTLDSWRNALIEAGQWEQAVLDADLSELRSLAVPCQNLTDTAAVVFLSAWKITQNGVGAGHKEISALRNAIAHLQAATEPLCSGVTLNVKLPEGFTFYTLFPEQYALAAQQWLDTHAHEEPRPVAVIGLRSIGTSLSALVCAVLRANGWPAHRFTVRPTGHPFEREAHIGPDDLRGAVRALIVDEGPGQSGSSMASVADACRRAGLPHQNIAFLPGHGGKPGRSASDEIRVLWQRTPRFVAPLETLRWNGHALPELLAARTPQLLGSDEPVTRIRDVSAGRWREIAYDDPSQWPAATVPFERTKYRCELRDGRAVLWKFAGLSADEHGSLSNTLFAQQSQRADAGWTVPPLGIACGFIAAPWIEGRRLCRADTTPALLRHIGRYIAAVAGPPLSPSQSERSLSRLQEMLYWNTWEALGESWAEKTRAWAAAARNWVGHTPFPAYGDGRLAPHEWILTDAGRIVKTDGGGHDRDHTIIGPQTALWDIAGAMVEWNVSDATPFLAAFPKANVPPDVLAFYRLAYLAFRLGQCSLCAAMLGHHTSEAKRLQEASQTYGDALRQLL